MVTSSKIPQVIITWPSWSGKTTLLRNLLVKYPTKYSKPPQYTTRKPRNDREYDDYVFLTREQFMKKLTNWDFIEYVEYNKELYAIWKYFDESVSNIFIAEPVWREALQKYFKLNKIPYLSFYLEIDEKEMRCRLEERRETVQTIEKRVRDLEYFYPSQNCKVIDATEREEVLVNKIHSSCQAFSRT